MLGTLNKLPKLPPKARWVSIVQEYPWECITCKSRERLVFILPGSAPNGCPNCVLKLSGSKRFLREFPEHAKQIYNQIKERLQRKAKKRYIRH